MYVAVDGNLRDEKNKLSDATTSWTHKIVTSGLFKNEVVLALMTAIIRTWLYPLQSTTFSPPDCEDIMKPLYSELLPKIGANRKFPKVFHYAPKALMGLGLPNMYTMQGTAQIKALMDHVTKDTMVGKLIHTELELANMELGVGLHLFDLDFSKWGHLLTDCWIKSLWQFCSDNGIELRGDYCKPTTQRHGDYFLMERLVENYYDNFTKGELQTINRCRIYLQFLTMADISTGDGQRYTKKAFFWNPRQLQN